MSPDATEICQMANSLGGFEAHWSPLGLKALHFRRPSCIPIRPFRPAHRILQADLQTFAQGQDVSWRTPLDFGEATDFQKQVWKVIGKIPRGEVRSYQWLAAKAGSPHAVRAAANACGANRFPVIIPCHRVIASDGSLGGFSGGLSKKRMLLVLEQEGPHKEITTTLERSRSW